MKNSPYEALVENVDLVHANVRIFEAFSHSDLGINVGVDLLDEEGLKDLFV